MSRDHFHWVKIADHITELNFGTNNIAVCSADGKNICIANYKDDLFAFVPACPHAGGRFADGFIDASGNVVCPLHHYKFCMANGRNVSGEGYRLKHWRVEERTDGVWVALEDPALFELLGLRQ